MSTKTIEELNIEEAKQYIVGVVFVTIMMVMGIIGNVHVIFVYAFRMKPSNHRIFILVLAVLDLIVCSIAMPFSIVDLWNPLTFTMVSACKVLRFINYFICSSSALVLLVISVERWLLHLYLYNLNLSHIQQICCRRLWKHQVKNTEKLYKCWYNYWKELKTLW